MLLLTFVVIYILDIIAESMARKVATLLLLVFSYCSSMEMRETLERTVMVRTTGSDLQPAATGYIYKKESDGPVSLTKMGETEVLEHFTKLYNKPEVHKELRVEEPPVASKKEDDFKSEAYSSSPLESASSSREKYTKAIQGAATHPASQDSGSTQTSEEVIKPVSEVGQEDDKIDGIANEEFDKLFEDYIKQINNGDSFADYLHGLGHYDHGIYHGYGRGDGQDYYLNGYGHGGEDWEKIRKYPQYGKGEVKDKYLVGEHERYYLYNDKGQKANFNYGNGPGRPYIHEPNDKGHDHDYEASQRKGQAVGGFYEDFKYDEFKKDNDFYNGQTLKGTNGAYRGRYEGYGSGFKGNDGGDSHETGQHSGYFGESNKTEKQSGADHDSQHSAEQKEEPRHTHLREFTTKDQHDTRKSFGYEIKH